MPFQEPLPFQDTPLKKDSKSRRQSGNSPFLQLPFTPINSKSTPKFSLPDSPQLVAPSHPLSESPNIMQGTFIPPLISRSPFSVPNTKEAIKPKPSLEKEVPKSARKKITVPESTRVLRSRSTTAEPEEQKRILRSRTTSEESGLSPKSKAKPKLDSPKKEMTAINLRQTPARSKKVDTLTKSLRKKLDSVDPITPRKNMIGAFDSPRMLTRKMAKEHGFE